MADLQLDAEIKLVGCMGNRRLQRRGTSRPPSRFNEQLGKVPDSGDTLQASHAKLEVLSTVGKRIGKVRVIREAPPATKNGTTNVTETKSI